MDLEEQTLRYYLSLFSVIIFLFYSYYIVHFQFLFNDKHIIKIAKGDSISKISEKIIIDKNYLQKKIYYLLIEKNSNILSVLKTVSKASNINYEITIIEGWEKYQLTNYLKKFFTTRHKRINEIHGKDYYFINKEKFFTLIKKNFFIEFARVFRNHYGSPHSNINKAFKNNNHILY